MLLEQMRGCNSVQDHSVTPQFAGADMMETITGWEKSLLCCALDHIIMGLCNTVVFPPLSTHFFLNTTFLLSSCHSPRLCAEGPRAEECFLYLSSLWLLIRIINPSSEPFHSSLLQTDRKWKAPHCIPSSLIPLSANTLGLKSDM